MPGFLRKWHFFKKSESISPTFSSPHWPTAAFWKLYKQIRGAIIFVSFWEFLISWCCLMRFLFSWKLIWLEAFNSLTLCFYMTYWISCILVQYILKIQHRYLLTWCRTKLFEGLLWVLSRGYKPTEWVHSGSFQLNCHLSGLLQHIPSAMNPTISRSVWLLPQWCSRKS